MIARIQAWGAALIAALVAVVAAFGWGRWKGTRLARREADERIASSEHRAAVAQHVVANAQLRTEVETDVLHLPTGVLAPVSSAVPASAADRLYDEWSRDGSNDGLRLDATDSGLCAGSTDRSDGTTNRGP